MDFSSIKLPSRILGVEYLKYKQKLREKWIKAKGGPKIGDRYIISNIKIGNNYKLT